MSNRRFIELSSSNRNRNQYPQPAEFEVPFSPPRTLNQTNVVKGTYYTTPPYISGPVGTVYTQTMDVADAVTKGVVEYYWMVTGVTGSLVSTATIDVSNVQGTGSSNYSNVYVNVGGPSGLYSPYNNVTDYYVGYNLFVATGTTGSNALIQSYTPSMGLFTLQSPLPFIPSPNSFVAITDPSIVSSGGPTGSPYIVLPGVDMCGKNILNYEQAYNGYYFIDETCSTGTSISSSKIVSYNYFTRTATLDKPIPNWKNTDQYSIRKTLPTEFISISSTIPPISSLNPANNSYNALQLTNCVFLDQSANPNDNHYNGNFIYIYPKTVYNNQTQTLTNIEGGCFYINAYIGALRACYVTSMNCPTLIGPTTYYPSYNSSPTSYPTSSDNINIVAFSNDNYTPLIYNGSVVSQNETVAYEISLVNLTLPNIILTTGARIAYYPYVYVELSNVTASSSSSKNVIYSNNPNSNRALFLVPITDINDPLRSPFIKLDAGSMTQTVKFKPNDCLKFSVFLPDGRLYQTIRSDYYTPSGPNFFCQIDALFGIKRLSGV